MALRLSTAWQPRLTRLSLLCLVASAALPDTSWIALGAGLLTKLISLRVLFKDRHIELLGATGPHRPLRVIFILVACVRVQQQGSGRYLGVVGREPHQDIVDVGDWDEHGPLA